ncbi:hypothetical protein AABL84_16435 [Myroides odoratimimus]
MNCSIWKKIQILSDLHLEFGSTSLSFDNADLIILAGDTQLYIKLGDRLQP